MAQNLANNLAIRHLTDGVGNSDDGQEEISILDWNALHLSHVGQVDEGDVEAEHSEHVAESKK